MLRLTQADLAAKAGISKTGLIAIETGTSDPKASTLSGIQRALEAAGVEFTNGDQPGVRVKATRIAVPERAFVAGLEKFEPTLRSDAQFDGLRIVHDGPTSASLIWQGQSLGRRRNTMGWPILIPASPTRACAKATSSTYSLTGRGAIRRARMKRPGNG